MTRTIPQSHADATRRNLTTRLLWCSTSLPCSTHLELITSKVLPSMLLFLHLSHFLTVIRAALTFAGVSPSIWRAVLAEVSPEYLLELEGGYKKPLLSNSLQLMENPGLLRTTKSFHEELSNSHNTTPTYSFSRKIGSTSLAQRKELVYLISLGIPSKASPV